MITKNRTVGIIGLGHVGAHVAYALGMMGIADEILICDKNEEKLISERQDLMDAVNFMPHRVNYKIAKYDELGDCDIIVNSSGDISLLATNNRDDEMNFTVKEVADYIPKVMAGGFNGIFVNITNPCDVITHIIAVKSGLPKGHVLGTGTGLDSSRLISAIAQQTGIEHHSFTAFMMGEHGNSQMIPWSLIRFAGKPFTELQQDPKFVFDKEDIKQKTINAAWVTYKAKGCTEYGVCSTAASLVRAILRDEKKIIPISAPLDGEYGEKGIFCGVPAIIGSNGCEHVMEYNLPADEMAEFKECCAAIHSNIAKADKLANIK